MPLSDYARPALVGIGIVMWWIVQTKVTMPIAYQQRHHLRWLVVLLECSSILYGSWLIWADAQIGRNPYNLLALGLLALVPSAIYILCPVFGARKALALSHLFGYALVIGIYVPLSGWLDSQLGGAVGLACAGGLLLVVSRIGKKEPLLTAVGVILLGLAASTVKLTAAAVFLLLLGCGYCIYAIVETWKAIPRPANPDR